MADFDLDLRTAEEELDTEDGDVDVVLGILDGSTDPEEWVETVLKGNVLVLSVEGDLNRLAAGFAREVKANGGSLMHFRKFLVVAPEGVEIDNDRLE